MKKNKKDLSLGIERCIDDLGRIVIPKEMRSQLNFEEHQKVNIKLFDNHIEIGKAESICCFCNSEINLECYNDFHICKLCIKEINKKFHI